MCEKCDGKLDVIVGGLKEVLNQAYYTAFGNATNPEEVAMDKRGMANIALVMALDLYAEAGLNSIDAIAERMAKVAGADAVMFIGGNNFPTMEELGVKNLQVFAGPDGKHVGIGTMRLPKKENQN